MTDIDAFIVRVKDVGWKVARAPHHELEPKHGDVVTCPGDPTAYHVTAIHKNLAHLIADETDTTVWVPMDDVTVSVRRRDGIWLDVRPTPHTEAPHD